MKKLSNDLRCLISIIIFFLSNSLFSEFQNTESIYQINYIIDPLDSVIGWNVGGINSGYEISIDKSETITLSDNPVLELKYDFLSLDNIQTLCVYHKIIKFPYEIAIPWKSLLPENRKIQPKDVFGFALLINDNDGDQRRGWIEYMQGISWTKDPNLLIEIMISE